MTVCVIEISRLGSSVADCFYAAVGVFGITLISDFLFKYQAVINIFGGVFIGTYIWWGAPTTVTNIIRKKTRKFSFMFIRCSRSITAYHRVNNNYYHKGELL